MTLRTGLGATYRVQLRREFGFADAARVVPYLADLGIETLYLSPIAEAVPGSVHGYDGTDPTRIRAELGGRDGYDALVGVCEAHGLGICVDHVPNHLATWTGGPWWRRLLAEGRDSEMGPVFDVDWESGGGKVTLPLLDRPLDAAVSAGVVRVASPTGETVVVAGEVDLPVARGSAPGGAESAAEVMKVLDAQHYRLTDWHDAADRNYRRFFDIDGLVGVRVEDREVFATTHRLVVDLAHSGKLSALRIDHVDGLRRPTDYLHRLAEETGVPIVVEKILTRDERLRADWPVVGTTGYETIDDVGGVLVDAHGFDRLVHAGRRDGDQPVEPLTVETRRLVAKSSFPGEIERSAERLGVDAGAFGEVVTRLPRYRTYLDDAGATAGAAPGSGAAAAPSGAVAPGTESSGVSERAGSALWHELEETAVWRALRDAAPGEHTGEASDAVIDAVLEPAHRDATLRVQQLTGALMAKGIEDTAWYRLSGPLVFCEVGADPGRDRHDATQRWHDHATQRVARDEHGLVPGTTHDTKRAQDVRSRLYGLSEMAEPFESGLRSLRESLGLDGNGGDLAFETRVAAQLALGVVPPGDAGPGDASWKGAGDVAGRLGDALQKGAREAKRCSSWTAPDEGYEERLRRIAASLLADGGALLRACFGTVADEVVRLGAVNSLAAVVLRHVLPGVPDCYQGDEVWNLSLVDPDNRRPVDFDALAGALDGLAEADAASLRLSWRDGRVKLFVTAGCLRARRGPGGPALAPGSGYLQLAAAGPAAGSLLSCARRAEAPSGEGSWAVAVVTRQSGRLAAPGDDLPSGDTYAGTVVSVPDETPSVLTDAISGARVVVRDGELAVDEVLASLPVALLVAG